MRRVFTRRLALLLALSVATITAGFHGAGVAAAAGPTSSRGAAIVTRALATDPVAWRAAAQDVDGRIGLARSTDRPFPLVLSGVMFAALVVFAWGAWAIRPRVDLVRANAASHRRGSRAPPSFRLGPS